MKKLLAILTVFVLAAALFAGCGEKTQPEQPDATPDEGGNTEVTDTLKTGLAVSTSLDGSADAGDEEGAAKAASTVVAVTVDADGRIEKLVIDQIQSTVNFDAAGKITSDLTGEILSKNALGQDYGMHKASSIGKEWNEQIAAFAAYCEGKTIDEIKGIAYNENGAPSDADLASSVTLTVNYFAYAIEAAVNNAQELGAQKGDSLALAVTGGYGSSKDAAADAEGLAQGYYEFAAVTTGADGTITSCVFDAVQANVTFDAAGKITTDLASAPKTKNELGQDYGMHKGSSIGKEWNEEAASFAAYVTGKTLDEVKGIAVDEAGKATDADLASSVTLSLGGFLALLEKAIG